MNATDLSAVAYPTLTEAEIDTIDDVATICNFPDGATLFAAGDTDFKFFVVKQGAVAIVEDTSGAERELTVHHAGEFTGDIAMLTGRPAVATAVARGTCEVYVVTAEELRHIVSADPTLGEKLLRAFIARRRLLEASGFVGVQVLGSRYSADTTRIREFLSKNRVPFTWVDVEQRADLADLLKHFAVTPRELPLVVCPSNTVLRQPTNQELGECLGIKQPLEHSVYDLVIIGAGPAGLAAAVYGASEGLDTAVLEQFAPGGQASSSSKIENYMGFPMGLSGSELAERAMVQAQKFGAVLTSPVRVVGMQLSAGYPLVQLDDGSEVLARCVLIATGAAYRRLDIDRCREFEDRGVHYAATLVEAQMCDESEVVVVGGGNSAGQAAIFLSDHARAVRLVVRGDSLAASMSSYLLARIEQTDNIQVCLHTEVSAMDGDEHLETVTLHDTASDAEEQVAVGALFVFIGADPHTDWLPKEIVTDEHGFIVTGQELQERGVWRLERAPYMLETSQPGIFAAGDVRASSVKRVASAVGEGSMAVAFVHRYLRG